MQCTPGHYCGEGAFYEQRCLAGTFNSQSGATSKWSCLACEDGKYCPQGSDAERNCLSNVRPAGLSHALAAFKLDWLLTQAFALGLSGVTLKDDSGPALAAAPGPTLLGDGSEPA